jgi:glycosyltransferase involved in cell wall biosynthesis/2-polyprenyl-3-methyl-5-hydroxy-6-metoxy-1,4-benzoquinol methylase
MRFPVEHPRDPVAFDRLSERIFPRRASLDVAEAEAWMRAQGPWSPALLAHLRDHGRDYDAIFFITYLYATTYFGVPIVEERALLVPTAHDEWPIELPIWDRFFERPRALLFNTPEERAFLERRFPHHAFAGEIAGVGVEPPTYVDADAFRRRFGIDGPFWLYVGRIEPAKGSDVLLAHYARYRERRVDAPPLVLIGRAEVPIPEQPGVRALGFVDDQTKWDALAACQALLMPSPYESLSIAVLEAWSSGRPTLVNGDCEVLVGQSRRAGGGLWYHDAGGFADGLDRLLDARVAQEFGASGRRFVLDHVCWERIIECYLRAADSCADPASAFGVEGDSVSSPRSSGGFCEMAEDAVESAPQTVPQSTGPVGVARAEQHAGMADVRSVSRLGFVGVALRRVVQRLTRFQWLHQAEYNQGILESLRAQQAGLRDLAAHLGAVSGTVEQLVEKSIPALGTHLGEVSGTVEQIVGENLPALGSHVGLVSETIEQLQGGHGKLHETSRAHGRHLDDLATRVAEFGETIGGTIDEAAARADKFEQRVERETRKLTEAVADFEARLRPNLHFDTFDFARKHRGSEEELTRRMAKYAVLFGPVERVLDVGCGRGEFLQACRETGVGAYGIEADPDMVSRCRMKALEAIRADVLEHLRSLEDRSLDGIFMAQVIEHLTPSEIIDFVRLAAEKIRRGGKIIIETINPDTFSALRWFWMDPTHRQPVSVATVRFLLEDARFTLLDVLYMSPVSEEEALQRLPESGAAAGVSDAIGAWNRNVEKLNGILFGDQDYAVIAER